MRIGELLVEAKLISREQLELGLAAQQKSGRKLGLTLIELGIVSETQVTQALSQQLIQDSSDPHGVVRRWRGERYV